VPPKQRHGGALSACIDGDGSRETCPDLGGEYFVLRQPPRFAIVGRESDQPLRVGPAWYTIDHVLGVAGGDIDAHKTSGGLGPCGGNKNVLVPSPPAGGSAIKDNMEALKSWVHRRRNDSSRSVPHDGGAQHTQAKEKGRAGRATRQLPDVSTASRRWYESPAGDRDARWEGRPDDARAGESLVVRAAAGGGCTPVEDRPGAMTSRGEWGRGALKRRDDVAAIFKPAGAILAARVDGPEAG
jgi:hypothetical protein